MANMDYIDIQVSTSASSANAELDKLIVKLSAVSKSLSSIGGKSVKFGSNIKAQSSSASTGFNNMRSSADKTAKSTRSLASAFGSLYANFFWVIRGAKGLQSAIEKTSDYIEDFNYYTVAFDKIASEWDSLYEIYGSENAQKYTNAFVTQMNKELGKMSGIKLNLSADMESGTLSASDTKNLGLNLSEVTQYASQLASITNSVGQNGAISSTASSVFTKLAGDMSSLFNVDYSSVAKNLQSGLIGQSRALYKYGIDITNATLQTYAYELGLEKAVSEMTQAEKMQLRMIAILEQSKVAWGDLADTINTPANMLRQWTNNLEEASMMLGQLFMPLLERVLPMMNGATIALKNFLSNIAGFMGITIDLSSIGSGTSGVLEELEDVTGGYEDATAAAKEYKNQLLGFDEITRLQDTDSSLSSSSSGSSIDLTNEIIAASKEYQEVWDEAFAKMENKAKQFANKFAVAFAPVEKLFKDIVIGDWFAVGQDTSNIVSGIFNFFSKAIANVDWQQLGQNIGLFLVGIDWTDVFSSLGELIGNTIEGLVEAYEWTFNAAPLETAIISAVGLLKFTPVGAIISKKIAQAIASAVGLQIAADAGIKTALVGVGGLMANTLNAGFQAMLGNKAALSALSFINPIIVNITGISSAIGGAGIAVTNFFDMLKEGFSWFNEILMVVGIGLTAVGAIILGAPAFIAGVVAGIVAVVSTLVIVIKDNWDSIVDWTLGLFENIKNIFASIKNNVLIPFGNYLKGKFGFEFEVVFGSIKGVIEGLKQAFNGLIAFITGVFTGDWTRAWNGVKDIFKGIFNGLISIVEGVVNLMVVNGINKFLKGFDGVISKIGGVIGLNISIPQIKKISIPRYEVGGFPEDGLFFANHNELVGQFSNGKTAVANNEQIVAGIKEGVREAVAEVLAPYLADIAQNTRETADKNLTIGSRDVFNAVRTESSNYTRRTGRPAFI